MELNALWEKLRHHHSYNDVFTKAIPVSGEARC